MNAMSRKLEKIAVAVQFDDKLESTLNTAVALCRLTGSALRLIHVADPWAENLLAHNTDYSSTSLLHALREENMRMARERLEIVRHSLPAELDVSTGIHIGEVLQMIREDMDQNQVDMVVIGGSSKHRKSPGELSMAVELATDSTRPVMVVPAGLSLDLNRTPIRLTIADDLGSGGAEAMAFGEKLASKLGHCSVFHTHVQEQSELRSSLRSMLRDDDFRSPDAMLTGVRDKLGEIRHALERQMRLRSESLQKILSENSGSYHLDIPSGTPAQEVHRSACVQRADMVIFGQHQLFHRGARYAGKIPFNAMLLPRRATIIIPAGYAA